MVMGLVGTVRPALDVTKLAVSWIVELGSVSAFAAAMAPFNCP
jgi:hypothetical protein